jgi:D-citramalate synthase
MAKNEFYYPSDERRITKEGGVCMDNHQPGNGPKRIEIMDTTLRDGEQTSGVSFAPAEKLTLVKMLLEDLKIDRVEVASARVSPGEFEAVKRIAVWAESRNKLNLIEVLGFVDGGKSVDWIRESGAKVLNLLCKGSLLHVKHQLGKEPQEHLDDIVATVRAAQQSGLSVNLYLEDWSNGMLNSPDYVLFLIEGLKDAGAQRIMLPDTLGIFNPEQTFTYCQTLVCRYPEIKFDFHAHNDYDLAVANTLAAAQAGVSGVHATVNGLGERSGNAVLSSVLAVLKDHFQADLGVNETRINAVSRLLESFTGIRIPPRQPIIGDLVFTQCCGVHADGDSKGDLYHNALLPERFGRVRKYALGKTAGRASIRKNLEELGIELDPEAIRKVTARVVELSDKKELITTEDLPYIISDVLTSQHLENKVRIVNYHIGHAYGLKPVATLCIEIDGKSYEETANGDGQYNAFMNALTRIYRNLDKPLPELVDYVVNIPPGGRTDALVETTITWKNGQEYKTRGLDSDQTAAAIKATLKMLNRVENHS